MKVLGNHLLAEYYHCNVEKINELDHVRTHLIAAAEACGATVVESKFHRFSPQGISGVVVLKESHLKAFCERKFTHHLFSHNASFPLN